MIISNNLEVTLLVGYYVSTIGLSIWHCLRHTNLDLTPRILLGIILIGPVAGLFVLFIEVLDKKFWDFVLIKNRHHHE